MAVKQFLTFIVKHLGIYTVSVYRSEKYCSPGSSSAFTVSDKIKHLQIFPAGSSQLSPSPASCSFADNKAGLSLSATMKYSHILDPTTSEKLTCLVKHRQSHRLLYPHDIFSVNLECTRTQCRLPLCSKTLQTFRKLKDAPKKNSNTTSKQNFHSKRFWYTVYKTFSWLTSFKNQGSCWWK